MYQFDSLADLAAFFQAKANEEHRAADMVKDKQALAKAMGARGAYFEVARVIRDCQIGPAVQSVELAWFEILDANIVSRATEGAAGSDYEYDVISRITPSEGGHHHGALRIQCHDAEAALQLRDMMRITANAVQLVSPMPILEPQPQYDPTLEVPK